MHSGTKNTPFNLAFGVDDVISIKMEINTLKVAYFELGHNDTNIRTNLDLLEESREKASIKAAARQKQVVQYYNKRVKIKQFNEGNLVLRSYQASRPSTKQNKLSPN